MVKLKDLVLKIVISSALAALIGGCAGQNWNLRSQATPEAEEAIASEEYESVVVAREKAIEDSDELVALDGSLESVTTDELIDAESIDPLANDDLTITNFDDNTTLPQKTANNENVASIWPRIRAGFILAEKDHPRVEADKAWFARHQAYLDRTFERAEPYLYYIVEQVEKRGMPMEIALLPVVESAFQPFAYSHGRASGIWQFIPGTARLYGLKIDWWYDGRRDIYAATDAALNYLETLNKRFDGDWMLALAAYNSGDGTVRRAIRKNKKAGKGTAFWDLNLPKETRGYVPKLFAIAAIVESPEEFGVSLREIPNTPTLAEIDIGSQLDLAIAADMADISLNELYTLNPAFNRWATAPSGPHRLLLPVEKAEDFKQKVAELPPEQRIKWKRHRIKEGESLGQIATKYHTTVKTIKKVNNVRGNMIRAGKHLIIPVASRAATSYALSAEQRLQTKQNTPKGGNKIIHTVRPGDTLWDISQAYKVSVGKLAKWNGMAPRDMLHSGQKLVIWSKGNAPLSSVSINAGPDATTRKINYRVRNGDSLARISQKFNVSIAKLKSWNPKARGKYLQPGQRLVLYVDVTKVAENS